MMDKRLWKQFGSLLVAVLACMVVQSLPLIAQTDTIVHRFSRSEGNALQGSPIQAADGNFYGVNEAGGLLKVTPAGTVTVTPGSYYSIASLVQTSDGSFWGTADHGVFQYDSSGAYHYYGVLPSGGFLPPRASLTVASDGYLYGVDGSGGNAANDGTIFKISQSGAFTRLHVMTGATDGFGPASPLVQASDGSFYGVTPTGGAFGHGTVFRITPSGVFNVLHTFGGTDGDGAVSRLWEATPGVLYGATTRGGTVASDCLTGCGTIFSIDLTGGFRTLVRFDASSSMGKNPTDNLFQAGDGKLYGTSSVEQCIATGPSVCHGSIYRVGTDGSFATAYLPSTTWGDRQPGGLLQANTGDFWGTTYAFRQGNGGYVFDGDGGTIDRTTLASPLTLGPVQISFNKKIVRPNAKAILHWQAVNAASLTMQQCFATIQAPSVGGGTWTGMQTGTSAGSVYSGSSTIVPTVAGTYTYALTCGGIESGFASLEVGIPPPLVIQTTSLPNGTLGSPYGPVTLQATGGDGEFHWSVSSGTLPPGLTLSDAGAVQGTPTQAGVYDFTVQVADGEDPAINTSAPLRITVGPALPPLSVQVNPTHILPGANSTISAALSALPNGPTATGTINLIASGSSLSTVLVVGPNGIVSTSGSFFANPGTYTVTAAYSGDRNYQPVTATTQLLVADDSTTTLASSLNPSTYGQSVTFTATVVQPGVTASPDGTMTFHDGGTTLGIVQVSGGRASLTTNTLAVGSHTITATYSGGANATPSVSTGLLQTVTPIGVTLSLTASPSPAREGDTVTLSLSIAVSGTTLPSGGSANFFEGTTLLGSVAATGSTVILPVRGLTLGSHTITAIYAAPSAAIGLNVASVTVEVLQSDFSLSANGTMLDVPSTGYGVVTLTLAPLGLYSQRVHLSCTAVPVNALCAFNQTTTAPLSQGAQKIKLVVNADLLLEYGPSGTISSIGFWKVGGSVFAAGVLCFSLRRRTKIALLALLACCGVAVQGCSSKEPAFTPAGDYTITIVGQDDAGRSHSMPLLLHVR